MGGFCFHTFPSYRAFCAYISCDLSFGMDAWTTELGKKQKLWNLYWGWKTRKRAKLREANVGGRKDKKIYSMEIECTNAEKLMLATHICIIYSTSTVKFFSCAHVALSHLQISFLHRRSPSEMKLLWNAENRHTTTIETKNIQQLLNNFCWMKETWRTRKEVTE